LYLFDANEMDAEELGMVAKDMQQQNIKYLFVGNKIDKDNESDLRMKFPLTDAPIFISAKNGWHLQVLNERMIDVVLKDTVSTENVIVTNARHYRALVQVNDALEDVMQGLENKIPGDLLSLDIRRSLQYLGEITGEITNEDQLDYIFSKFCIGK
jgi:tRNA modification GTPase